jgi:hypothetical protein
MFGETGKLVSSIALAFIGLAIAAVIVSKNSQTPSVISAIGTAFSSVITSAVAPVSGSTNPLSSLLGSTGAANGLLGSTGIY